MKDGTKGPTLEQLEAMPVRDRALVFLAWLRAQDPEAVYTPGSYCNCALAQFGATVGWPYAGTYSIASGNPDPVCFEDPALLEIIPWDIPLMGYTDRRVRRTTFKDFADYLAGYLLKA